MALSPQVGKRLTLLRVRDDPEQAVSNNCSPIYFLATQLWGSADPKWELVGIWPGRAQRAGWKLEVTESRCVKITATLHGMVVDEQGRLLPASWKRQGRASGGDADVGMWESQVASIARKPTADQ